MPFTAAANDGGRSGTAPARTASRGERREESHVGKANDPHPDVRSRHGHGRGTGRGPLRAGHRRSHDDPEHFGTHRATTTIPKHVGTHARAATPRTLTGIKAEAAAAVTTRVHTLNLAVASIGREKGLGDGLAPLRAYLGAAIQPLQQQGRIVAADTTVAGAQREYEDVFSGFRVYHLLLPAASLAARADRVAETGVPALKAAAAKAQAAVHPQNQVTVGPLVEDLNRQIAAASSATRGLASTVLAYTPAQWNADDSLLSTASTSVTTAEGAIRQGRADVVQIRQDLRRTVHGGRARPLHHDHR